MLSADVDRYLALRRALGYKLVRTERYLSAFARFHDERGEAQIRSATLMEWLAIAGETASGRSARLRILARFVRFLQAEDARHEAPPSNVFVCTKTRPTPYIYTSEEIARILDAAGALRDQRPNPLRRELYVTLFGLIAATGLRISEAIALRFEDVRPDGVLFIRETKFCKSRLVPMHPSVVEALRQYLTRRRRVAGSCDYLFPSVHLRAMCPTTVNYTFRRLLAQAGIAPGRARRPRIHDLRHTFATRALERCGAGRGEIARHFVALSTYLGHSDIRSTYWYLQASPEMMTDIAAAAERLIESEGA